MEWQLQDAKNQFSKLVQMARSEGRRLSPFAENAQPSFSRPSIMTGCAGRPTFVDDLLGGQPWDDELVETTTPRAKTPSRDVTF